MKIISRIVKLVLPALAISSVAAAIPSSSVGAAVGEQARFTINSTLGQVSPGYGTLSYSDGSITVSIWMKDKPDGYYVTLQARPLVRFASTGYSQWGAWRNIGTTGNERAFDYRRQTIPRAAGTALTDVEVRLCQTNAGGTILGRCSVVVPVDGWYLI